MAIVLVQEATNAAGNNTSLTVTLGSAPTNGNLLVGCNGKLNGTDEDTSPTGWTQSFRRVGEFGGNSAHQAHKIASGDGAGVTFTWTSNAKSVAWVGEYSGMASTSPLDQTATNNTGDSNTSMSTGTTGTTVQADELAVAQWVVNAQGLDAARAYGSSFAEEGTAVAAGAGEDILLGVATKILTATGTVECTVTDLSTTNEDNAQGVATYKAAASGQTVAVGQVTETDLAQVLTRAKELGLTAETDLAQAVVATKTAAIGLTTETDLAQVITAQQAGGGQTVTVGQTTETDTAQTFTRAKTIGPATQTDEALAITATKTATIGQVVETDLAQTIILPGVVGQAVETDTALGITATKAAVLGLVTETDTAQGFARALELALAVETDLALGIGVVFSERVAPAERTFTVPAENRTHVVAAESRTFIVSADIRSLVVT